MTKAKLLSWNDLTSEEQEEMRERIMWWLKFNKRFDISNEDITKYHFWKDKDGFLDFSRNF